VVVFHALDEKHIKSIAKIRLAHLEKRLASMDLKLEVTEAVLAELANVGFDPIYGARPLKRAIQHAIENPLAREILEGRYAPKDGILVEMRDGRITFGRQQPAQVKAA
jgi:ATP-dependent Clp protease ATP-binding subunit ClpB